MSKHHAKIIESKRLGLEKIFYVLPPHDNDQNLKKINFGIFSNLYTDGRKNEKNFENAFSKLDTDLFKLTIIGKGWDGIVKKLRKKGKGCSPHLEFLCYTRTDEAFTSHIFSKINQ